MVTNTMVGLATLAIGLVVLVFGLNASRSVVDRVSNTFTGRFTDATTWYIIIGVVVSLAGLFMMFSGRGKGT